jgi:hypothetical protein
LPSRFATPMRSPVARKVLRIPRPPSRRARPRRSLLVWVVTRRQSQRRPKSSCCCRSVRTARQGDRPAGAGRDRLWHGAGGAQHGATGT